jgi:GDP/UDP-N,N'-diacetylbacillosamine 2-epimerase (hydrolysing)
MSHIHFVAAIEYKNRVIQLGESPKNVYFVGGMGVDAIKNIELMDKKSLEESIDFNFSDKNLMVTFHPETLDKQTGRNLDQLLLALDELNNTNLLISMPNSDPGNNLFIKKITKFSKGKDHIKLFTSLGQLRYLSSMSFVDAVIGNSSSGLLEAPSFGIATINIGPRQNGRLKANSVIDCSPNKNEILKSINSIYDNKFKDILKNIDNPYGNGGASFKIIKVLKSINYKSITTKKFNDIDYLK